MSDRQLVAGSFHAQLYNNQNLTAAISGVAQPAVIGITPFKYVAIQNLFTYGSGGTSADVYIQTSLDGGVTWFDIANFHNLLANNNKVSVVVWDPATPFTANTALPGSGTLTANTITQGLLGDRIRALINTVGTYGGTTKWTVDVVCKG